ncbi:HEPN domain-containing protein [Thioclava litoralis]|uniref:HEPN domain-containing protein n=1 Tax=Thioclava litoralis TaxID=3076557 RepID=A0ABZ1DYF9_9RHOB|nr:HEPN domain-containing protein [Thioclava sp. FTW29]
MSGKKPLTKFHAVIDRSNALLDLHSSNQAQANDDLIRAAIVLSVAAFDGYFTNKFVDILVPYLKTRNPGSDLVKLLGEAGLDTRVALELLGMERPYRRIRTIVSGHLSGKTTQRFDTIDKLFLSIGLKNLSANAAKTTKKTNINARIGALIEKRHAIAHTGDLNSHGNTQPVNREKIRRRIQELKELVDACDKIIDSASMVKKVKRP